LKRANLITGAGVVASAVALAVLIGLFSSARGDLSASRSARQEMLALKDDYLTLKGKIDALERKKKLTRVQGIIQAVDNVSEPLGLKEKVKSVKPLGSTVKGEEKAEVSVQAVSMNEMVNFLYAVENAPMLLVVRKINIKTSFENPQQLNLSLTLSLIKPE